MYYQQFWLGNHLTRSAIGIRYLYSPDCHLASKRGRHRTRHQRISVTAIALSQWLSIAGQTGKSASIKLIPKGVFHLVVERDQAEVFSESRGYLPFPLLVEGLKVKEGNALCIVHSRNRS